MEKGSYWFYGWASAIEIKYNRPPTLMYVEVNLDMNKNPMYVTNGFFLYISEGAKGLWTKAILPTLPKLEKE